MTATTMLGSGRDEHGNPISGPADAIELYDRAVDRLLRYKPEVVEIATTLAEEHSGVPMTSALMAYLNLASTDERDVAVAVAASEAMAGTQMNERERAHQRAIAAWARGDWTSAASALDAIVERWPADLLALIVGHQLDFFLGHAANLRDRPGRSLPDLDQAHPHTALVRGMQAFGLEESGSYEQAEAAGLEALAVNPEDVWALHAVVHTHEIRGQVAAGIRFLRERESDWGRDNLFTVHNWWHLTLFQLEAGDFAEVLRIYDSQIHHAGSAGVPLEMLDASALLWRMYLDGHDVGGRFEPLADAWSTWTCAPPWYAFNDVHAAFALVGAGRVSDVERLVERLLGYVSAGGAGTNVAMTAEVGLPASRAALRFAQGRYDDVIAELLPIRRVLQHFGGSHAQRDALQRTLLEAALRAGRTDLARALIAERLAVRETSVYGWTQRTRLLRALGRDADAAASSETAAAMQAAASAA